MSSSLRRHEQDVLDSLIPQVRKRVAEEVEFVALCFSPARGLASAGAYVRDALRKIRAPIRTGTVGRSWVAVAITSSKIHAFECTYLPVDVEVYPKRLKASAELGDAMGEWDRVSGKVALKDTPVATQICLGEGDDRLCVYAPKPDRMSKELVRLLRATRE